LIIDGEGIRPELYNCISEFYSKGVGVTFCKA
jgi:hypothetical protein